MLVSRRAEMMPKHKWVLASFLGICAAIKGLRSDNAEIFDFFELVLQIVQIWMGFKVRFISMYKPSFESFLPPVHESTSN